MKPKNGEQVYKLIHSQEMVQYMWKYSVHRQSTQIPLAIAFDEELDFKLLARAVNIEIERNDCMRLRIFRDGLRVKQYFLNEYKLDKILIKEFSSKEEQVRFFDGVASTKLDVFGGETFRVIFFRTFDGKCGVFICAPHMIMDFVASFMFFKDLIAVYDSLKNGEALPRPLAKYEDIIIKEQDNADLEERIQREKKVLDEWVAKDRVPFYNAINGTKVLDMQRKLAQNNNVVMDGRDIGTVVLPDAQIKIFLTADVNVRAERRYKELIEKGTQVEYKDVLDELIQRDYNDSHREIAPLKPAEDSVMLDTTGMNLEESVNEIIRIIKEKM